MANYAKVRLDNMTGTKIGSYLVSAKYSPSNTDTAIENGNVVLIGGLATGEREIHTAGTPAVDSSIGAVALVASVEFMDDPRKKNFGEFRNEAGDVLRCYYLNTHDVFAVTAGALTGTLAVGKLIELAASTKLKAVASITSGSTAVGKIIAKENDGLNDWYVIEVTA